jgi:hypothetical protein
LKQDPGTYLREKQSFQGVLGKNQKDLRANTLKQPGWTSDLKFGKLRGVRARFWVVLELFLN